MDSPALMRVLNSRHSSGRWLRGSQPWLAERCEKMRSLARLFSSSRRAPPKAASNFHLSSAWRRASVFMTWVWTEDPEDSSEVPRASPASLTYTSMSKPSRAAISSRNAIISRNFQVVSTCSSGNGSFAGENAFCATCSKTLESLPAEYSITGLPNSATTSRKI
jgi:hypothetical protein